MNYLSEVKWDKNGLVPAVSQDTVSGKVLTLAWMNEDALKATIEEGRVVYWSRSRKSLWRKGEQSGFIQKVRELRLDCDSDSILLIVEQVEPIACHTGRATCFYKRFQADSWVETEPVIKEPTDIYL
jgi:phosphoribosyl-AMP cyclohydrolase